MANVFRQITLNELGLKAGPYYDVYYSADCSTYTIATDGSNVYLPSVGSQVVVTIPDSTQCLKLVNLSPDCGNNFVVENIALSTTTTTTSTTTSTSTTTTTISPTTTTTSTTTTVAPKYWYATYCSDGTTLPVPLKVPGNYTTGQVVSYVSGGTTVCLTLSTEYVGTPLVFFTTTQYYVSCAACGVTTSTTTTSTTTTAAPVWYNLYNCSNGQTETSAQYPAGTFSVNQRVVYGGALYFYVISSTTSNPGGIQWSVTSAGSGLVGCPATTTTTSTTTIAPITLTVSGSCSGGFGTGRILANNFAGSTTGIYSYIAIGTSESNAITNVSNAGTRVTLSGALSYTFTNLVNGNYWVALMDSTGRIGLSSVSAIDCGTTTTTSTSTTTIALPPFSFLTNTGRNGSSAACSAAKTIYLWAYSNTWDNGVTYYSGTSGGADVPLNPYPGASQWFAYGGNALQIDDNGLSSNITACPTTTTTTTVAPTTTTTTAAPTTTTTTLAPVYYQILSCVDSSTAYSIQYSAGTYNSGDRVITNTSVTCVVIGSTTTLPGGTLYTLSSTGLTGCPATTTTSTTTIPPMDFTFTQYCSNGLGYATIDSITGGAPGGQLQYSWDYGVNWYNWPANITAGPFANGSTPNVQVRNLSGGGTNKSLATVNCATTTTTSTTTLPPTTTTTTTQARVSVNFYLNFDAGNDGTLDIYTASPAGAGYTLSNTLTTDGSSYSVSLLPGDGFYATITQTARAASNQRGQITTDAGYYVTGAGSLPQSVSSDPIIVTAGHAPYNNYGLCGDQV
jgi:hypothetical protein